MNPFRWPTWRLPLALMSLAGTMLLAATVAQATSPRINALGGAGDYFEDDANVRRWVGSLPDYPGTATVDFGHFNIYHGYHDDTDRLLSGPSVGVHHALGGRWGTLGAYLHTRGHDALTGSLYRDDLDETFTLMYCRQVGLAQLGLTYRQGSGEAGGTADVLFPTRTRTEDRAWSLGARVDLGPGAYLDMTGELRSTGEELEVMGDGGPALSRQLDSESGLALRSRVFARLGERTALVPVLEYAAENRPVQPQSLGFFPAIDGRLWRLGCGINFFPDTDHFFYAATEYLNGQTTYSYGGSVGADFEPWTHHWSNWNLTTGWETRFLPWLTLRASAGYHQTRGEATPAGTQEPTPALDSDDLFYTLGCGIHLGGWDLDTALSEQEPLPFAGDRGLSYHGYRTTYVSVALRWSY